MLITLPSPYDGDTCPARTPRRGGKSPPERIMMLRT
jgi:hypothetical protein